MNTLGNKLRVFRKLRGFSQLELELAVGLSTGTISRIENNDINPTKETLLKISRVFELNKFEQDYLIGISSEPPTDLEIKKAVETVYDHFNKKMTFAYLMDDRNRIIYMSEGFARIIQTEGVKTDRYLMSYFTELIINTHLGIRQFLDAKNFDLTAKDVFMNSYAEMHFMEGDKCYEEMMEFIRTNSEASYYWNLATASKELVFRTLSNRTISFKYKNIPLKLTYSIELLWNNQRFRVIEYKPSNILLKIFKTVAQ